MAIAGAAVAGAILAAATTMWLVPAVIRLASGIGSVDMPGERRVHTRPTPRLGGIAIAAGLATGTAAAIGIYRWQVGWTPTDNELWLFAGSASVIFLLGVLDDVRGARVWVKLAVQLAVAGIIVKAGWAFQGMQIPLLGPVDFGPVFGAVLSVLWLVGITNAINLVDGLDGLAGGISAIIAAALAIFAALHGDLLAALITAAMAGACLGFLRYNWAPARIFMGDSGSLTLGFLLAAVSLHSSLKTSAAVAILVPFLALGLPAIDTLLVMMVRFLQKPHGSVARRIAAMFNADRNHLHHVLLDIAPKRHRVVWVLYLVAVAGCLMALAVVLSHSATLGYTLILVEIAAIVLIRSLGADERAGAKARSMRERALEAMLGQGAPGVSGATAAEPRRSESAPPTTESKVSNVG